MNKVEIDNLIEFVSYAKNRKDFIVRINHICQLISLEFYLRLQDEIKFDFQLVDVIDNLDKDFRNVITQINEIQIVEFQPKIQKDLFLEIIRQNFPEVDKDYQYHKNIINN